MNMSIRVRGWGYSLIPRRSAIIVPVLYAHPAIVKRRSCEPRSGHHIVLRYVIGLAYCGRWKPKHALDLAAPPSACYCNLIETIHRDYIEWGTPCYAGFSRVPVRAELCGIIGIQRVNEQMHGVRLKRAINYVWN